jgi:hypothetical protein
MRSVIYRGPIRSVARVGAAIASLSLVLACGGEESPTPAPSPEPTAAEPAVPATPAPPTPSAEAPAPGPDAGTVTEGVIPEGYPSDIPVYPGADPGPAMTMPGLGVFATFESDDATDAILAHFRSELGNNGWAVQDSADGTGVDGTKEGRSVQVRVRTAESGRSEIAVSAGDSES